MAENADATGRLTGGITEKQACQDAAPRQFRGPPAGLKSADTLESADESLVAEMVDGNNEAVDADDGADVWDDAAAQSPRRRRSRQGLAALTGTGMVVALAAVAGLLGVRAYESHQVGVRHGLFLQAGRHGAIDLTTIDFAHVDSDVARILDSATGTFYGDFSKRSRSFTDVVKQARSKSVGTVTEAGIESASADHAQVLVAVSVKTSSAGIPEQEIRAWRMRMVVQKMGDRVRVSNVEFMR